MSFLYKHYEKIILAVFLLVFVLALVYLIMVFGVSGQTTEADLKIRPEGENYTSVFDEDGNEDLGDAEKGKYSAQNELQFEKEWIPLNSSDAIDSSDLFVSCRAARCHECHMVIPFTAFDAKKCVICKKNPGPKKKQSDLQEANKDTDGDGFTDEMEIQIGLDPNDPSDKWSDLDEDGFLNFTEFQAGTKLDDPKSHPPLADRLSLIAITKTRLPVMLQGIDTRNSKKKKDWDIRIKVRGKTGRPITEFKNIGDTITLDKQKNRYFFIITDAEYKTEEKFNERLGRPVDINISEITIQNAVDQNDKPITVVIKKSVFENKARLGFKDTYSGKEHLMKNGDTFTVGDTIVGSEKYTVIEVDDPKTQAFAKIRNKDKKEFDITKISKIDEIKQSLSLGGASSEEKDLDEEERDERPKGGISPDYEI